MPTYISKSGLEDLKEEFEKRKKIIRKEIAEKISSAKELGDLSENFEYHDAKEQQALNEARISQIDMMLSDHVIVEPKKGEDIISLGVTFTAEVGGEEREFQVVGSSEADPLAMKISNESPLGLALIGHRTGDEVIVSTPSGGIVYKIVKIN